MVDKKQLSIAEERLLDAELETEGFLQGEACSKLTENKRKVSTKDAEPSQSFF